MRIPFTKMHGLGNDFVVIDATQTPFVPTPALLRHLTDRRFGIGCDQVLIIEPPPAVNSGAAIDFGYRIFNADGSESGQCGNGARCVGRYLRDHGMSAAPAIRIRTPTATMELSAAPHDEIRVNMGVPEFTPARIPLALPGPEVRYALLLPEVDAAGDAGAPPIEVIIGAVSMGNPHAVLVVPDVDTAPVEFLAPRIQRHPAFPEGVNVGFLQIVDRSHARLRVYERGAGETLACGSGACAAMAIGRRWDLLDASVDMQLRGGNLHLDWASEDEVLWMTGPATPVFEGSFEWPS